MPLYKQWQYPDGTQVAIWKIEEPEHFFEERTGLHSLRKNPIRRLEHLAGRFLLQYVWPAFPLEHIAFTPLGKPYLPGSGLFFSVSHSYPYVAAAIRPEKEVGIDLQMVQPKIIRLQEKFLSPGEMFLCQDDPELLSLAWSAKEAAFKWFGAGAVDFIVHMPLIDMQFQGREAQLLMNFNKTLPITRLSLQGALDEGFVWSVTL